MELDPQTVVCLLAVQQLGGGQPVPVKLEVFKGLKKPLQSALDNGWIEQRKDTVVTVARTGKAKNAKVDVLTLTAAGKETLEKAASPEALAAAQLANVQAMKAQLDADRQSLRQEVLAAFTGKNKSKTDPAKEIAGLARVVQDLAKRLEKLEAQNDAEPTLQRIDEAFARLAAKLQGAAPTAPGERPAQPAPSLGKVLKTAYDELSLLLEFEEGLIPLPRLYHQARAMLPALTVGAFHDELQNLWQQRTIELHELNEARTASEPDKALRHGDHFLYYVHWKKS